MAYWYCASIRTKNEFCARHFVDKYQGQTFVFNKPSGAIGGGEIGRMLAEMNNSDKKDWIGDTEWWVNIGCLQITDCGIGDEEEAKKANEFCNIFYGMLRNEVNFDYAILGVEVGEFRSEKELFKEFQDGSVTKFDGLVFKNNIFQHLDMPFPALDVSVFQPFSPTHTWIPKKPEKYPHR